MTKFVKTFVVTDDHSARHWASGDLNVLATPTLVAFMENTAYEAVQSQLEEGKSTVGAMVTINHLAPTKIGQTVTVTVESTVQDGKLFHFDIVAHEGDKCIGTAKHTRAIITVSKFLERLG